MFSNDAHNIKKTDLSGFNQCPSKVASNQTFLINLEPAIGTQRFVSLCVNFISPSDVGMVNNREALILSIRRNEA